MQAEYQGGVYFDTNGASAYMKISRTTFLNKRKPFLTPTFLPGYERPFYSKEELDNFPGPRVVKIETLEEDK